MKKYLIILLAGMFGCASWHWCNFYKYTNVNPEKFYLNLPDNYEECLHQFDSILSQKVINHYKGVDSTIASIEISQAIGGLFINFWNLSYYGKYSKSYYSKRRKYKPGVLDHFMRDGISDPQAMVRVLFKCYHKQLNGLPYNWKHEIRAIKSYWVAPEKLYKVVVLTDEMRKRENEILGHYHFKQLNVNDTVDVLYNRNPKLISRTPDWYYLTGIIQHKVPEKKAINIKLISIESVLGDNYMVSEKDTVEVGDTLTDYCKGWLKRGVKYFNYNRNEYYREN